jgi:hypothetical protein
MLGDAEYQVGIASYADGSTEAFLFNFDEMQNVYVENPLVTDGQFAVLIPDDLISDAVDEEPIEFHAVLSIDGVDVDACPDG